MKEQRIKRTSDGMRMLVAELTERWKVAAVQVTYSTTLEQWTVEGRCVADGHPVAGWAVGNFYVLGAAPALVDAIQQALTKPVS